MTTVNAFGTDHIYDSAVGHFISQKHRRIAEIINEYEPSLSLAWIPPDDRTEDERFPFAVVQSRPGQEDYIVMLLREDELDERVLARLWTIDASKNDPMARLNALEAARKAIEYKEELERREEMHDRAKSIFHSPLHTYRLGGGRKVDL